VIPEIKQPIVPLPAAIVMLSVVLSSRSPLSFLQLTINR
jgi:hypothetical protein